MDKQIVKPTSNRVVVQHKEIKTESGIFVMEDKDKLTRRPAIGVVLAVGPGDYQRNSDGVFSRVKLSVGDEVLYAKNGAYEVTHNGIEALLLAEESILAVTETQRLL